MAVSIEILFSTQFRINNVSRRVKKKSTGTETPSSNSSEVPDYNRDVYGHLRTKSEATEVISSGTSSSVKIVALVMGGIILFSMGMAGVFQNDFFGGNNNNGPPTVTNNIDNRPIGELCVQHSSELGIHWHYLLKIYINNDQIPIDPDVGISNDCMHALHTHDASGKLHLELPSSWQGTPRLGDFFAIWSNWAGDTGITLSGTSLMGTQGTVTMKSDGFDVTTSNPANYILGPSITGSDEVIELFLTTS